MFITIEITQAIELTAQLVAIVILIDTIETFFNIKEFRNNGIFSWKWLRQYKGITQRRRVIRKFADLFFGFRVWFSLLTLRWLAAISILFFPNQGWISSVALLILFIFGCLANFRRMPYRPLAPLRFTLIIIGALFLQSLVPTETVTKACLWFIALQSCLSYATAGFVKLFNKDWLDGTGVLKAVNSKNLLVTKHSAIFFQKFPIISKFFNYFTLIIECLFPLVLVVGSPFFFIFLIWGVLFHFTNVVLLRLNNYFWAWISTYPAIIFIAQG